MRNYKIHTKYGAFEFTGRVQKETDGFAWYDTQDGRTLKFNKKHIVMIDEGKQFELFGVGSA